MKEQDVIKLFKDTRALLCGHFELRSGMHSNQYFQCAKVLQFPYITENLCEEVVVRMHAALGADYKPEAVIAPAMGGISIGHEVGRHLRTRFIFAEKEEGRLVLRRGFEVARGQRFIVAEDVITRGGRVQETVDIVTSRGGVVEAILVLVDRSGGQATFEAPVFSLLRMTPETWMPEDCPLCRQGMALDHPGSK